MCSQTHDVRYLAKEESPGPHSGKERAQNTETIAMVCGKTSFLAV